MTFVKEEGGEIWREHLGLEHLALGKDLRNIHLASN